MTLKLMKLLVVLVTCSWVSAVMQSSAVCDVIVAGGSLASLAAAVTAANVSAALQVCFLDPTDWPGGQLTASAVPAVDFGPMNGTPENNANSFASFLWGALMPAETNLGACWVSKKCFLPTLAMDSFVFPLLRSLPNIAVYLRTAVSFAVRDAASGNVTSIVGITRTPVVGTTGWETTTSAQLADWYDPSPSAAFTKTVTTFNLSPGGVVVEATEFGDVLMTAGLPVAQGIEIPAENSTSYQSYCGQASTVSKLYFRYDVAHAHAHLRAGSILYHIQRGAGAIARSLASWQQ